jgi:multicomponent Na+:H+ antiporter subunit G
MIAVLQDLLAAVLILIGSIFALTASIGLIRLPDLYTRMHAASKAGTLGSCVMLIALALHADDFAVTTRALGGVVFFLLTVPVSSHLLAKTAHASGLRLWRGSVVDDYAGTTRSNGISDPNVAS